MYEIKEHIRAGTLSLPVTDSLKNLNLTFDNFDDTIMMGHNNHNLLQHLTLNEGSYVVSPTNPLVYTPDTPKSGTCLGACLLYNDNSSSGYYSVKHNISAYRANIGSSRIENSKIILMDDSFTYNDVFVHFKYVKHNGANIALDSDPDENTSYISISPTFYQRSTIGQLSNIVLALVFKTDDDIIFNIVNQDLFIYNGNYQNHIYLRTDPITYLAMGRYDNNKLSGTNPDDDTITYEYQRYSVSGYFRDFLFNKINKKQITALCNAAGLYYTVGTLPTQETINNKIKIGYMDNHKNIDVYKTLTGIEEINDSDTNNKDLSKLPEWEEPEEKDKITNMIDDSLYNYQSSMLTKYYKISATNLLALSNAITTNTPPIPEGLNVFDNIVSVNILPFDVATYCRQPISDTVKIYNWDSGVSGLRIDTQTTNKILATVYITRLFNDFRDYEPYTSNKLYLPLYGVVDIPNFCVGRYVRVSIQSDIIHNKFTYVLSVGNDGAFMIYDKVSVNCGSSIDFTAITTSLKSLNVAQSQISLIGASVSGVSSVITGNTFGTAQSVLSIASAANSVEVAKNKSYTQHTSVNGAISDLLDSSSIYYIKIKSVFEEFSPETVGFLYNRTDMLSNHSGYCICNNTKLELQATKTEKEIIKSILETGFYI